MGKRDPRVDAYIAKSADFAKPILRHFRELVHDAVPEASETMKWSVPHFDYNGVLAGMAAFKQHCNLILWKASIVMGGKGNREGGPLRTITKLSDLPPDKSIKKWLTEAAKLNEQGVKTPRSVKPRKGVAVPAELTKALAGNKKAATTFESFPPSHRREYAEWIAGAKGADTRQRRVETAVEWIAEGKGRNWKYEKR
ncbi:MAG TPA: YdeI/OmpD-associated family protein [Gemmatimonadaceae bacterium]|jgi:hypothetical protein|nr:YdeI/OmpD-associated family protein [Gemmatimonadaceae bacterium]